MANRPSVFNNEFFDAGTPAAGYKLYTYATGTTTPKATYTDQAGAIPNTNPITLDADGMCELWLGTGEYTLALYTGLIGSGGALVKTWDDVAGASTGADIDAIRADLANPDDPTKGAGMIMVKRAAAAVARSVLDVLISDISLTPEDFGAKGDDVTDDTIAINLAIGALGAGGGTIKFDPSKVYRVSQISLLGKDYVTFEGDGGKTQSTIRWTGATGDVVDLSGSRFITWRRLNFLPLVEKTGGSLFKIPAGATDHYFEHVRISSARLGWDIDGDNVFFKHVEVLDYNAAWPWYKGMQVGLAAQAAFIEVDDFIIHSQTVFTGQAIHINNVDTFIARALFVQKSGAGQMLGVYITGGEFIQFHQCHMEPGTAATEGFLIAGGSNINLVDCHATTGLYGVRVTGGKGIEIVCGRYYSNARNGIRIEGGTHVLVDGAMVSDNSTAAAGTWDGISVAADVSDFRVVNNGIGSVRGTPINHRYGIYIEDGASDRYVVANNTIADYSDAAVYDGGTGAKKSVHANTGSTEDKPITHNTLTTTDATAQTLWQHTLMDESAYYIEATVITQASDTSSRAAYKRTCLVYRDGGGVATIQGQSSVDSIESNAALDCTFDVSANAVRLRVTGLAGTTIRWRGRVELYRTTQLV